MPISVLVLLLAIIFATSSTYSQTPNDWAAIAIDDLNEIHAIIEQNHPGPVDDRNPDFKDWLVKGHKAALEQAKSAQSRADFERALRFYVSGFRDGHLKLRFKEQVDQIWPGFLTISDWDGSTTVTVSETTETPKVGDELIGCDGIAAPALEKKIVHRFRTNSAIPHEKQAMSVWLFISQADDLESTVTRCDFKSDGDIRSVPLKWRPIGSETTKTMLRNAQGTNVPPLQIQNEDGVWFVSVPSFNWWDDRAADMEAFISELREAASVIRDATTVVIDVRGNTGGNSNWGNQIASVLWTADAVGRIYRSLDWSVDWRVSIANIASLRENAERSSTAGLAGDARYRNAIAAKMEEALVRGDELLPMPSSPAQPSAAPVTTNPFSGDVYFLTDWSCASACLDFADLVLRMPNVTHIGLPTSADTVYIDNTTAELPSGKVRLSYSLKVYRKRIRGNNEWYTPEHEWPGGRMTNTAIGHWLAELKATAGMDENN